MDHQGTKLTASTICTTSTNAAKEIAIALAAPTNSEYITVITDSQVAGRNYQLGRISPFALKILNTEKNFLLG